jgi:hypothetical protein
MINLLKSLLVFTVVGHIVHASFMENTLNQNFKGLENMLVYRISTLERKVNDLEVAQAQINRAAIDAARHNPVKELYRQELPDIKNLQGLSKGYGQTPKWNQ